VDLEAIDSRHIGLARLGHQVSVCHDCEVRKGGAKVGSIRGSVLGRSRIKNVAAARAVDLDSVLLGLVRLSDWKDCLASAQHPGASPKFEALELVHLGLGFRV
jgi:hypothetical protein